ncbi:GIY-YIG nuclease family protein [Halostagnicola bangensis]
MTGTYVLVIDLERATTLEVGALGSIEFEAGVYAYVGTAFGPGGFARVDRHAELARGDRETRHWHIDYLLGCSETSLERAVFFPGEDSECALARTLPGERVPRFGASDCDCLGHLLESPSVEVLLETARDAGGSLDPDEPTSDVTGPER